MMVWWNKKSSETKVFLLEEYLLNLLCNLCMYLSSYSLAFKYVIITNNQFLAIIVMAYQKNKWNNKWWRIFKNEDIKAFTILVVDEEWEQIWTMPRAKALELASGQWLDLVQINYDPKTKICTAKMIDFGKYQYENKKMESEKRKKQKTMVQKEIKFWYNIWDHDLEMKVKRAIDFLKKWNPVKINVVLRWREKAYKDIVRTKLVWVEEQLKDHWRSQGIKSENYWYTLSIMSIKKRTNQPKRQKLKKIAQAKRDEAAKKSSKGETSKIVKKVDKDNKLEKKKADKSVDKQS